jgi:hypothetical protein
MVMTRTNFDSAASWSFDKYGKISPNTVISPEELVQVGASSCLCQGRRDTYMNRVTRLLSSKDNRTAGPGTARYTIFKAVEWWLRAPLADRRMSLGGWIIDEVGLRKLFKGATSDSHKNYLKAIRATKTQRTKGMA